MLIQFNQQVEKINDILTGKIKEGLSLGVPAIDEWLRFKPNSFDVILGHANVGKTNLTLYLMLLYSRKHNLRWLIFSSENEPYTLIKKLVEFLEGEVINKIPKHYLDKRLDWINNHFKFIDNNTLHTYKSLLELGQAVKNAWNYHGFLIDPYNSLLKDREVLKGIGGHEYDYQVTSEMRVFCKTNNVSIWLNTHAATEALRKKYPIQHEYAGHPIPPMGSDIEGGGKFINRADNFYVIHRMIYHPSDWMYSHIHVRKVKDIDTGGRPTPLESPIYLKSMINNVGYEIAGKSLIEKEKRDTKLL